MNIPGIIECPTGTPRSCKSSDHSKRRRETDASATVADATEPISVTKSHRIMAPSVVNCGDLNSMDMKNIGKEVVKKFTGELDTALAEFLATFPTYFEYCTKMISTVRELNPRHASKSEKSPARASENLAQGSMENPIFPDNSLLLVHLRHLRGAAHELIVVFDSIQDWILVHVPTIKDEDNSGVEVQETVVAQVAGYYKLIKNVYTEETEYLNRRGELETSMMKQPKTVSWRKSIEVQDAQEWDDIEHCWRALVRVVMLCQNLLVRNMEKLKEPRSMHRTMHI
mmetsp:Transcript_44371/g.62266  ORF Transcript_44371/g.62266 Transcript_44371/m.62266 type:complete len:284 (-) Transcript_44371:378-1229(-)